MATVYVNVIFRDKGKPERHLWVFGYDDAEYPADEVTPQLIQAVTDELVVNGIVDPDLESIGDLHHEIKFIGVQPPQNPTVESISGSIMDDQGNSWMISATKESQIDQ